MGKTLIAALLLATATPTFANPVTSCHSATTATGGIAQDCVTEDKPPTEEDIAEAHHIFHFWERRGEWREAHCGKPDDLGQPTKAGWLTAPIGLRKYVFDQCHKPY